MNWIDPKSKRSETNWNELNRIKTINWATFYRQKKCVQLTGVDVFNCPNWLDPNAWPLLGLCVDGFIWTNCPENSAFSGGKEKTGGADANGGAGAGTGGNGGAPYSVAGTFVFTLHEDGTVILNKTSLTQNPKQPIKNTIFSIFPMLITWKVQM